METYENMKLYSVAMTGLCNVVAVILAILRVVIQYYLTAPEMNSGVDKTVKPAMTASNMKTGDDS